MPIDKTYLIHGQARCNQTSFAALSEEGKTLFFSEDGPDLPERQSLGCPCADLGNQRGPVFCLTSHYSQCAVLKLAIARKSCQVFCAPVLRDFKPDVYTLLLSNPHRNSKMVEYGRRAPADETEGSCH